MRNNKIITESLNKKIIENEKRMQNLVTIKESKLKSKSLYQIPNTKTSSKKSKKKHHKKNKSQEEIGTINATKPKKLKFQYSTIQYDDYSEESKVLSNKKDKKFQSYSKSLKQREKNVNKNTNDNNQINTSRKVNQKELEIIVNRLYTNANKRKSKIEIEKDNSNTLDFPGTERSNNKNSKVIFDELYSRFQDDIKKRNENLEKKREEINNNNKTIYTYKPKLNINKKFFDEKKKENFLERQKKFFEEKKRKEERIKEDLLKKEVEEINKSNILNKNINKNKIDIKQMLKELTEWDENRKKKIEQKKKEKEDKIENAFKYMPTINKKSESLAKKNKYIKKELDVFTRLAKEDKILKEKYQILQQLYTPTFRPNITVKKRINKNIEVNKEKEFNTISGKFKSDELEDNSGSEYEEERSEGNYNEKDETDKNDNNENNIYTEENIQNAYRKALFHKYKK